MTRAATLVLARAEAADPRAPSAETVLFGMSLVRRTALAAARAGFDRVLVLGSSLEGGASPSLAGTIAQPFPGDAAAADAALPPGRIVLLSDRIAASPQWLRSLHETPVEPGRLHRLGSGALLETSDAAPFARALANHPALSAVVAAWAGMLPPPESDAPPGIEPPLEVTRASDLAAAEERMLATLRKKEDGILTRLVSRRISLAVTRRLAGTSVTPNAMTLVCFALGLAAAWSFASPDPARQIAGGVLFLLHSILDGCDGELARLKFQESRLGGTLDFLGDNLVHVAVFSAFAVAWSSAIGKPWPYLLGALAVGGTILCAAFIYTYAMKPRAGGGPLLTTVSPARRSRLSGVLDALARRDFIYLVMIFALFGKAYWFLAPVAVGTPAFFVALLVMALVGRGRDGASGRPRPLAGTAPS